MNPRPKYVKYLGKYKLGITFTNDEVRLFDLSPYHHYPVYEALKDETLCAEPEVKYGTVVWNDETDMDPDRLYLENKPIS